MAVIEKKNDEFSANQSTESAAATYGRATTAKSNHEFIEFKLSEYFALTAATIVWLHFYRDPRDPRQETPSSTTTTGKIWFGQKCL